MPTTQKTIYRLDPEPCFNSTCGRIDALFQAFLPPRSGPLADELSAAAARAKQAVTEFFELSAKARQMELGIVEPTFHHAARTSLNQISQ